VEILHVASSLAGCGLGVEGLSPPLSLDMAHLAGLGVADRLQAWQAIADEELRNRGWRRSCAT
jgi:hypothetical protein